MPTIAETTSNLIEAIRAGKKVFPIPGLSATAKVRYNLAGRPVGIYIYGELEGLTVTPLNNGAGRPPKPVNKFLASFEVSDGALKKFASYAHKVHKYLKEGGEVYAEHWDAHANLQSFRDAPANVYAVRYVDGESNYDMVQASALAGENCLVCHVNHAQEPRIISTSDAEPAPTTEKEAPTMKKYTAVTIKNNEITYHGMFETLAEAKDTATQFAGFPVKRAGEPYPYEGGVMLAGAHEVILKRHKAGAYIDISLPVQAETEPTAPTEEPQTVEPVENLTPQGNTPGVIRVINTGAGINAHERAELIAPEFTAAMQDAPPVFLKFSHYTETNKLYIKVDGPRFTPVVIDRGTVCEIQGAKTIDAEEDVAAAIIRLLKAVRPINKAVNAGLVTLTPAGVVSPDPVTV